LLATVIAPVLLFLGLAGWAGLVVLSLWPLRRPHKIAMGLYRLIYRVTEVPQVVVLLAMVTVAPLFVVSRLQGRWLAIAWIAVGLLGLGLAVLLGNGLRSWSDVDRGLQAAGLQPTRRSRPLLSVLVRPFPGRPRSVEVIRDVRYGDHPRHRLDVYRRREGSVGEAVLVYFHGGGYFTGDKGEAGRPLLHHLAERGWLCVSANYRLRPEAGMAEHLADARAVIRWVREHAVEYGTDPLTVVAAGSSAGAHLATLCALTPAESTRLDGLICVYGWFLDYAEYFGEAHAGSTPTGPFDLDPAAAPPTLLVHGSADVLASPQTARELAARFAAATPGPAATVTFRGGQHGLDAFNTWRAQAMADGVDVFVDTVLGKRVISGD